MDYEILGTEIDKKGSTLIIKNSNWLAFSPAYTFFLRQFAELADNNHTLPCTLWEDGNCGILWAELDGTIVGIIAYNKQWAKTEMPYLAIQLTAVDKNFRERGIHKTMNKYFEQTAKKLGCQYTRATVNVDNRVRLATAKKDGLSPRVVVLQKEINYD